MRLCELGAIRPSMRHMIHPVYRLFFDNHQLSVIKYCWRIALRRRYLRQQQRRIRFNSVRCRLIIRCPHCHFASNSLPSLRLHICTNKSRSSTAVTSSSSALPSLLIDAEHEQQLALIAHRSRCKDVLALLERTTVDPQIFHLPNYGAQVCANLTASIDIGLPVPSLASLSLQQLLAQSSSSQPKHHHAVVTTDALFHDQPTRRRSMPTKRKYSTSYLCNTCQQLFSDYCSYDAHLDALIGCHAADTLPDPIEVCMHAESNIPKEYDYGQRYAKYVQSLTLAPIEADKLKCTVCNRRQFRTIADLHLHVLDCAQDRICCSFDRIK